MGEKGRCVYVGSVYDVLESTLNMPRCAKLNLHFASTSVLLKKTKKKLKIGTFRDKIS